MHFLVPLHQCSKTITHHTYIPTYLPGTVGPIPVFMLGPPVTVPQNNCVVKVPALSASPHQLHLRGTPGGQAPIWQKHLGLSQSGSLHFFLEWDGGKICSTSTIYIYIYIYIYII